MSHTPASFPIFPSLFEINTKKQVGEMAGEIKGMNFSLFWMWLIIMISTFNFNAYGADWKKVEEDYQAKKAKAIAKDPPDCYVVRTGNKLIIFDSRPELGIGVHEFDQEVIDNLKKANIRFIRTTMYWYNVENTTEKGKYNQAELERWDKRIDLLQKNKIIPLIVVHGNAPGCSFANRVESYS